MRYINLHLHYITLHPSVAVGRHNEYTSVSREDWKGTRQAGAALALRHRHSGLRTCRQNSLRQGEKQPAHASLVIGLCAHTLPCLQRGALWNSGESVHWPSVGGYIIFSRKSQND